MDTKSKNTNARRIVKVVCVLLSIVFALSGVFYTLSAIGTYFFYGSFGFLKSEYKLEETAAYHQALQNYVSDLKILALRDDSTTLVFEEYRNKIVNTIVDCFLEEKAGIVRNELQWCVDNDESDGRLSLAQIVEILDTCEGTNILEYEDYVRESAFEEAQFDINVTQILQAYFPKYDFSDFEHVYSCNFSYSEDQFREAANRLYDDFITGQENIDGVKEAQQELSEQGNLRYYVISKCGTVYTNMKNSEKELKQLTAHNVWLSFKDGKLSQGGLDSCMSDHEELGGTVSQRDNDIELDKQFEQGTVYFYIADSLTKGDVFYSVSQGFDTFSAKHFESNAILGLSLLLLAAVALIVFLYLCGYKNGYDGIKLAFIDKVPTDIHLVLSGGICAALIVLAAKLYISFMCFDYSCFSFGNNVVYSIMYTQALIAGISAICAVAWLVFAEWLASTVRIKKAGQSYFKSFVGVRLVLFIAHKLSGLFVAITYKPKTFRKLTIFAAIGFVVSEVVLISLIALCIRLSVLLFLLFLAFFIAFNIFVLIKLLVYIEALDEIISASSQRRHPNVNYTTLPASLKLLVDSMSLSKAELDKAVETAVRDERMKTDLITNVSHDLKTPLTSVISYVDLLKRCDLQDETARGYIDILEEKSSRLKTLIEDLLEASKASSGNVTLNCGPLNLSELVCQADGEMSSDFESAGLELILNQPQQAPVIFADGQKTYRIIENLFNNARKYSATGSRVYVSVWNDDNYGYMQVKNVSRDRLNISPQELTERFVRGDKSRTDGGNGLGLAIAKDLCELQSGSLYLEIDGDLFKATVALPISRIPAEPRDTENLNDGEE